MAYGFSRLVTIDHTKVPNTDQGNFPLLFSGTYAYLATVANGGNVTNANGYDIIFTSDAAGATKLDHEIESYDPATGAVNFWVRIPTLSHTTDTVIYLWYGNAAVTTSQQNVPGVWDANFKAVWHLNASSSDSSSNGRNGTDTALAYDTAAQVAKGARTTGNPCGISIPTATLGTLGTGDFTVEMILKPNAPGAGKTPQLFGSFDNSSPFTGPTIFFDPLNVLALGDAVTFQVTSTNRKAVTSPSASSLYGTLIYIVYTRIAGVNTIFYNAVQKLQFTDATSIAAPGSAFLLSRSNNANQAFSANALGDEYRVSNVGRSADWITATYNSHFSPSTFYTVSGLTISSFAAIALETTTSLSRPTAIALESGGRITEIMALIAIESRANLARPGPVALESGATLSRPAMIALETILNPSLEESAVILHTRSILFPFSARIPHTRTIISSSPPLPSIRHSRTILAALRPIRHTRTIIPRSVMLQSGIAEEGVAQAGGAATITLPVGSSTTNGFYIGMWVTQGGETGRITAYNGSTLIATVTPVWIVPPTIGTPYSLSAFKPGTSKVLQPTASVVEP